MTSTVSLLISSHNRLDLFKRTLWTIAREATHSRIGKPGEKVELVVVDDSEANVRDLLLEYVGVFDIIFARVNREDFQEANDIQICFNNPAWTNNVAFSLASGDFIYLQGNEIIPEMGTYQRLRNEHDKFLAAGYRPLVFSSCHNVPLHLLEQLDEFGSNFDSGMKNECSRWPLQDNNIPMGVTNYLSLCHRDIWEDIGGYNEEFLTGIAGEDSDFLARAKRLQGAKEIYSNALVYHQYHPGKTIWYDTSWYALSGNSDKYNKAVASNRKILASTTTYKNPCRWQVGKIYSGKVEKLS